MRISPSFRCALLAIVALLAARTGYAQPDPLQAGRTVLANAGGMGETARLELPAGGSLQLDLPDNAEMSSLAEAATGSDNGWIAAGSFRGATGRRELLLLEGDASGSRSLPVPADQIGTERRSPVVLVSGGRLAGLAWLEGDGDRSLAVRAAAWNGEGWDAPARVSQPGPGSQLALAGAVLGDGSWLLAWSAFDGEDDEIVWSRFSEGRWSPAKGLTDNHVPDITPTVVAAGRGARIAWSRFDGNDYRLRGAGFANGAWVGERWAAPAGSVLPAFRTIAGRSYLLYFDARPRAWAALEMDASGTGVRRAEAAGPAGERPAIFAGDAGEVRFRWPGANRDARSPVEPVEKTP